MYSLRGKGVPGSVAELKPVLKEKKYQMLNEKKNKRERERIENSWQDSTQLSLQFVKN